MQTQSCQSLAYLPFSVKKTAEGPEAGNGKEITRQGRINFGALLISAYKESLIFMLLPVKMKILEASHEKNGLEYFQALLFKA